MSGVSCVSEGCSERGEVVGVQALRRLLRLAVLGSELVQRPGGLVAVTAGCGELGGELVAAGTVLFGLGVGLVQLRAGGLGLRAGRGEVPAGGVEVALELVEACPLRGAVFGEPVALGA